MPSKCINSNMAIPYPWKHANVQQVVIVLSGVDVAWLRSVFMNALTVINSYNENNVIIIKKKTF